MSNTTERLGGLLENRKLRKMIITALCAAVAVTLSWLSFPIGPARCFPVQHAVNTVAGILLGPWYALAGALISSTIRNLLGTGSILAFPGSVFGALAVGLTARALSERYKPLAAFAEPLATAGVGAWVSTLIVGGTNTSGMFFMLSTSFFASSATGAVIGCLFMKSLQIRQAKRRVE